MTSPPSNKHFKTRPSDTKVAVIGLGLSGLACLKRLMEQGFDVVGFERNAKIGGLWRWTPDTTKTSVLKSTQSNTSKQYACFQDYPFPDDIPDYPSAAQVLEYLESYADHFGLLPHCRFRTALRRIDRLSEDDGWSLEIDTLGSEGQVTGSRVESFDKVIVATGPFTKPYLPKIDGMEGFKGQVIHAQAYKSNEGLEGKRVAVVGLCNSGCDIAVDVSNAAEKTLMIHRSGGRIVERAPDGTPQDHKFSRRLVFVARRLPSSLQGKVVEMRLEQSMRSSFPALQPRWGILPAPPDKNSTTIANEYFIPLLHQGKLDCVRASIERFTPTGLDLKFAPIPGVPDDQEATRHIELDTVILATGYRFDYSPFSAEADPVRALKTPAWDSAPHSNDMPFPSLYQTIFSVTHPYSLAFVGPCEGFTFAAFKHADLTAQAIGRIWLGYHPLPNRAMREKWCENLYLSTLPQIKDHHIPRIGTNGMELERWLNVAAGNGVEEHLGWGWKAWRFWWEEGGFWKMILGGVDTPFLGQIFEGQIGGRKAWPGARAAIEQANRREKKME